jgi:hypothetical protein
MDLTPRRAQRFRIFTTIDFFGGQAIQLTVGRQKLNSFLYLEASSNDVDARYTRRLFVFIFNLRQPIFFAS